MQLCLRHCRSLTCGRCTRNAAGTSSPQEIASVNSTKTSSARAERPGCPEPQRFQQRFRLDLKMGRLKERCLPPLPRQRRHSDLILSCSFPLCIYLRFGLVYDSALPFTSHKSLHNFCSWTFPGSCGGHGTKCRAHYAPETQLQYFREC